MVTGRWLWLDESDATSNGGVKWTNQWLTLLDVPTETDEYNELDFVDSVHGWVVGDEGTIIATSTAGYFVPEIRRFAPAKSTPGTPVVIYGRTSTFVGVNKVLFNGKPAKFRVYGEGTRIRAVVPAGARSGRITVVSPAGSVKSATSFTVQKDYLRGTWYSSRQGIALTIGSLRMTREYGFHRCTWRFTAYGHRYEQTFRVRRSGAYWKGEDKAPVRIWQRSRTRLYVTWVGGDSRRHATTFSRR